MKNNVVLLDFVAIDNNIVEIMYEKDEGVFTINAPASDIWLHHFLENNLLSGWNGGEPMYKVFSPDGAYVSTNSVWELGAKDLAQEQIEEYLMSLEI